MAIASGSDTSVRPSLKCVASISCRLALTKKYCCLRRSSLPCGVESSGYSTRDRFFAVDLFAHGRRVIAGIERLDVERRDGAARPEPQMIDGGAAIARNQLIETDGVNILGIDPSMRLAQPRRRAAPRLRPPKRTV